MNGRDCGGRAFVFAATFEGRRVLSGMVVERCGSAGRVIREGMSTDLSQQLLDPNMQLVNGRLVRAFCDGREQGTLRIGVANHHWDEPLPVRFASLDDNFGVLWEKVIPRFDPGVERKELGALPGNLMLLLHHRDALLNLDKTTNRHGGQRRANAIYRYQCCSGT